MDRRFVIALALSALVFFITPMLFPSAPPPSRPAASPDTVATVPIPQPTAVSTPPPAVAEVRPVTTPDTVVQAAETTVVATRRAELKFSNVGAAPVGVLLRDYRNLASPGRMVELGTSAAPLLAYAVVSAGDTTDLRRVPFSLRRSQRGATEVLEYTASAGAGQAIIRYQISSDTGASYLIPVTGEVRGFAAPAYLLVSLPTTFPTAEADTGDDRRQLAYVFKPTREGSRNIAFHSLDPGERQLVAGPHAWAAAKTKYFVVGILAPRGAGSEFSEAIVTGGPRTSRIASTASAEVVQPILDGSFSFELYAGPQEWKRLLALGREFDQVNPYGWRFLQGMVQPFATVVMRVLLWLHNALQISYGWVLVIFGIGVRIVLWPLNQSAMKSSLKMQHVQPKLVAVQKRYANDPMKQREEIMRVYKETGASPFTAVAGCLPMLLPMPFLVALFFIFQSTIEFRGVPFMWLEDISIKDPYYALPLVMGGSMYVLSWIGLRNAPPNPQAKMMSYVFPVMMTFFLVNLAAGLNLYYAVQNIAALPQQWLIARQRARAAPAT